MKYPTKLVSTAIVLFAGCRDLVVPTAPELPATFAIGTASGPVLAAPSNAGASAISTSQIDVSWRDNSGNETGFELHRSIGTSFDVLTTTGPNVLSFGDTGLAAGTRYCYQVRAFRVTGRKTTYSSFSNMPCDSTQAPPPPPPPAAASEALAVPSGSRYVSLSWTDNSSNEDGFRIDRSMVGGTVWEVYVTTGAAATSVRVPAAVEQAECYRIVALNSGGEAAPSNAACTVPPAGPTNLVATRVDSETVTLTWSDNSAVEDGYEVYLLQFNTCFFACDAIDPSFDPCFGCAEVTLMAALPTNTTGYTAPNFVVPDGWWNNIVFVVATRDGGSSDSSPGVPWP